MKKTIVPANTRNVMSMSRAFDEWMAKYIADTEKFQNTLSSMKAHGRRKWGHASEYGLSSEATLRGLMSYGKKYWKTIGL